MATRIPGPARLAKRTAGSTSTSAEDRAKAIATLQSMLDYAIVEGAELKLQTFVYLLYMARLELNEAGGGGADRRDRSEGAAIGASCLRGAAGPRISGARAAP